MGFLILAFPVLEIWGLFYFGAKLGFVNTLFWLLAAAVLGFGLIRAQGVFLLKNFQSSLAKGQVPADQIFHSLLMFVAGVMLIIPGFFTDVLALILIVPGPRHVALKFLRARLEKKIREGSFRMASFGGMGGMGGFSGGFGGFGSSGTRPKPRDVTPLQIDSQAGSDVIDVTPIKRNDDND